MIVGDYISCRYKNAIGIGKQYGIMMTMSQDEISTVHGKIILISDSEIKMEFKRYNDKNEFIYTLKIDKMIDITILDEIQYRLMYT